MKDQHSQPTDDQDESWISKTQVKQELHELKAMGRRLIDLKPDVLNKLPLTESLRDAIEEAHRIKSNNASKRHLGFIGKLMQQQDIEAISTLLNRMDSKHQAHTEFFHQMEHWRDRLIGQDSNNVLSEFLALYPSADIQYMRQLIRNSQKEASLEKPLASSRKLFRYIRELCEMNV